MLIPLTRGRHAIVDEADATIVAQRNWSAWQDLGSGKAWYAVAGFKDGFRKYRTIKLHRFLWQHWGLPDVPEIDHENTNGLDCRRLNLRVATSSQNKANRGPQSNNTSGFKGVTWNADLGKWSAFICVNRKRHYLGSSADIAEAAALYEQAAREAFGEFARIA